MSDPTAPRASEPAPALPAAGWGRMHIVAVLLVIAAFWAARELLVPIFIGLFLSLVANPSVNWLQRRRLPRWLGAMVVVFGGLALSVALASQLVAPAGKWVQKAPRELRQVAPKLRGLFKQVDEANRAAASIVSATGAGEGGTPRQRRNAEAKAAAQSAPKPPSMWGLIKRAPGMLAWTGAVILLSYFFVVFGLDLQYRAIGLLPERKQKRLTHEILRTIELELSRYVMTISMINLGLALALSLVFWQLGLAPADAVLWGAIGGLLNFAPYVGPVIGVLVLLLVGVVAFDSPTQMLLPALSYLGLQLLESEVITPIILGRRWSISPLILMLWLLFCGWLWGIPGVLLAVPVLVCFKIVADRVEGLQGWSKVIE